ncbi:MAG: type II toxin-antitoxin system Phd/YefM family antitoxin [Ramlibacter sp.]
MITISSREFNQDTSKAKKQATEHGVVFITDRGRPAHVLMSVERYQELTGAGGKNILELLAMPESADIEFEPPRIEGLWRPADLS